MKKLEALPPLLVADTPLSTIMMRIVQFSRILHDAIQGTSTKDFVQANRLKYSLFKAEVANTSPDFREHTGVPLPQEEWLEGVTIKRPNPITLDDVRETIQRLVSLLTEPTKPLTFPLRHITWELPSYIPFEATKELVLQHIQLWKPPMTSLREDVFTATLDLIHKLIHDKEHFGQFPELQAFVK